MQVITLAQVKEQLGISGTDSDALITAKLPYIDSIVKQATNRRFSFRFSADMTLDSSSLTVTALYDRDNQPPSGINNPYSYVDVVDSLEVGMEIEGDNIPAGSYIMDLYKSGSIDVFGQYQDIVYITLSENATATESGVILTGGITIAYKPVIAKGVQYLLNQTSTTINDTSWTSKSEGPLSVSKGDSNSAIDGKTGMPAWFIKGLPRYQR